MLKKKYIYIYIKCIEIESNNLILQCDVRKHEFFLKT